LPLPPPVQQAPISASPRTGGALHKPRTFITLDALRGVAAIPVIYTHTVRVFGWVLFPHGFLAVDFFFLLSGFVMTYVYQEKLDAGWPTRSFFTGRLLRLYPLYFMGLILGAAFLFLQAHFGKKGFSSGVIGELLVLGLFFLPVPPGFNFGSVPTDLYPLNTPAWSLFYELAANFLHALFLRRRSLRFLTVVSVLFAGLLLFNALRHQGLRFGVGNSQYLLGFSRLLFAYPAGVAMYRVWKSGRWRLKLHPVLIAVILLALVEISVPASFNGWYEWLVVTAAFPLLLLAGANTQPPPRLVRVSQWLGAVSYPVYILHVPFYRFFEQAWVLIAHHRIELNAPWAGIAFLVVLFPLSFLVGDLYDPEARRLLHSRLIARRVPQPGGDSAKP
jgi:peptidoglycan/LPS O-acetylase OafA/YrhL